MTKLAFALVFRHLVTNSHLLDDERQRPSYKPVLESMASVDVRILMRNGMLHSGSEVDLRFSTAAGTPTYHVVVAVAEDALIVSFDDTLEGRRHRQKILLVPVKCHYGGYKTLLFCSSCGKRRVALYLLGMRFRCRICNNSRYWSQCHHQPDRMREKAHQIRERLGGSRSLMAPFPDKPIGMHWSTYLDAVDECEQAESIWTLHLIGRFRKRLRG